jgi:hypothetical protein
MDLTLDSSFDLSFGFVFFFAWLMILSHTIPIRGTASDVVGIDSATKFKNTVSDRRIVTPGKVFAENAVCD